jgi:predicted dehydrogenase
VTRRLDSADPAGPEEAAPDRCRVALIGCGARALAQHLPNLLADAPRTTVVALCDPDPAAVARANDVVQAGGQPAARVFLDAVGLLAELGDQLDAAVVASPPAEHAGQMRAALGHRLDVLTEKPATVSTAEAEELLALSAAGPAVVVAFQGALSPERARLRQLLLEPDCTVTSVHGALWENWRNDHAGSWRHDSRCAGGGFVYDSGLHLLNAVVDIVGPLSEVTGHVASDDDLQLRATLGGRSRGGAVVNLTFDGDVSCRRAGSELRVCTSRGVFETGVWGKYLRKWDEEGISYPEPLRDSEARPWQRFLQVRRDPVGAPSDLLNWLYVRDLYDAFLRSAGDSGRPVSIAPRHDAHREMFERA